MKKKIGIIGGADPAASCLLYRKIINTCLQRDDCKNGADFPEIVIINYPFAHVMQVHEAERLQEVATKQLQHCFDKLDGYGVDMFAIACNTYHAFVKYLSIDHKSLVHIVDCALDQASAMGCKRLLILGTQKTIHEKLYSSDSCLCLVPNREDQILVDDIIERVQQGTHSERETRHLDAIAQRVYKRQPFDAIVLACTDLPALHEQYPLQQIINKQKIVVIDTLQTLAQALVLQAFNV